VTESVIEIGAAPDELELPSEPPDLLEPEELELLEALLDSVPELETETVGVLGDDVTWMEKARSAADAVPSLAVMMIFGSSPASDALGVPDSWPVSELKLAHAGLFWMLNVSDVPVGAAEVG
jgi:hypothetical protein